MPSRPKARGAREEIRVSVKGGIGGEPRADDPAARKETADRVHFLAGEEVASLCGVSGAVQIEAGRAQEGSARGESPRVLRGVPRRPRDFVSEQHFRLLGQ